MVEEERFEVFDETNTQSLGTERRSVVHRTGLYHRSVNVLAFDTTGRLLIQKRASNKDVCPDMWDLSVGEHLKPGETYEDAARRGLMEELNLPPNVTLKRLYEPYASFNSFPSLGIDDREYSETYVCVLSDDALKQLHFNEEVSQVEWVDLQEIIKEAQQQQQHSEGAHRQLTPWFMLSLKKLDKEKQNIIQQLLLRLQ